jgi:sugar porter (SP) family MFS transporter
MLTPLYLSENAPRAIRGALTGLYQFFNVFGIMLAFWINYGCNAHLKGTATYVVPLSLQAMPAIILFIGMFLCNESPRLLAKQDKWEQAKSVLSQLRHLPPGHPYLEDEFGEICQAIEREKLLVGGATFWNLQREMWTIPGNRKRTLLSIGLMICQQMTGTNALNYYAPQIFRNLGITGTQTGLFATGVYGIVKLVAVAIFLVLAADSLGRRKSLLWTSVAQSLCMFYIGLFNRFHPTKAGEPVPPGGYVSLVCVFLFAAFFQFGWGPVCWIYVSEIPAARLRAMTVAIGAATQWLFNFVIARAVPNMLATVGHNGYGTYLIFGSFCASMFVFTWFFVPETKGLSLEKMDDLFGVTQFVEHKIEERRASALEEGYVHDEDTKVGQLRVERV